ncbi:MAG: TRAP transporter large permease subunit [Gammaproteobacteria bacterium]|nr:TRAP transporter large permease subunit [Gammaproteobacteria bacterium]
MEYMALMMFVVLIILLMSGYPVAFALGAVGLVFGIPALGMEFFDLLPLRIWGIMTNFTLLAVPLFVFMGVILEKSGLAEDLLETMALLFGRVRGGLTVSLVLVGGLLAATTGVVGATVVTMTVIALPAMMKNGYQAELSTGTIAASGTLGQLIPPSIILVLLADQMGVPVPRLFAGAVVPGLVMITLFIGFILVMAMLRPGVAPLSADSESRWPHDMGKRVVRSLVPPMFIMIAVLGSIFFGIAGPTESAAFGAMGAMMLAALHKRLTLDSLRQSTMDTMRLTSMVFMILIGATIFGLVFRGMGGDAVVQEIMSALPGGEWGFLLASMVVIFVLGFFLDFLEICFIIVPILAPIAVTLGLDPLWFAILIAVNLQTSFLTPPFGFSLFYLKAAAPASIRMEQIYRGVIPFIIIQVFVLASIMMAPQLVLWLPDWMDSLRGY